MLELGVKLLTSYLLGALNGALIVGFFAGGVDIRKLGSGNAGGTNALRTMGAAFALPVMLIDVGKGYLPAAFLPNLVLPGIPLDAGLAREWLAVGCAGAAVIGHCYPVWFGFVGGKGAATALGALAAIAPGLLIPGLAVWGLVLMYTGFVGLATMLAMAVMPVWVAATSGARRPELLVFLVALAAFIAYTHRGNIRRMRDGCESRIEKAMLLRRRAGRRGDDGPAP